MAQTLVLVQSLRRILLRRVISFVWLWQVLGSWGKVFDWRDFAQGAVYSGYQLVEKNFNILTTDVTWPLSIDLGVSLEWSMKHYKFKTSSLRPEFQ